MKILITGAKGQLGKCIKDAAANYPEFDFLFASRELLNIESEKSISNIFKNNCFDYCINTAAYTNVEKAESEKEKAFLTNAEGVKQLAKHCAKNNTILIQISTDYVFDGKKKTPYTEEDTTRPLNFYGASKLKGEKYVQEICQSYYILRTSWLYSQYGQNFYNTVLRFSKERKPLTVTTEQTGTPTNANDLAEAILAIIKINSKNYGIYNFSNQGEATWYDFAKEILIQTNQLTKSNLVKTDYYRTFAARPKYSVMTMRKYKNTFNKAVFNWKKSLKSLNIKQY
ncbi:MAG: dTDP-4-dehydrorhamnose reductase [Flavobacteriaceae bacterium]|nr:dTDP-4-dehydrorhamnose reductase [Flavobacteriaceae bacterium]|tara:strand:+ start:10683 stop:11534 length:852 start_codon:yes stop_codon:yes gene_type:complete